MRKAVIYVFSGTGNTRAAADFTAGALLARGIGAEVWEARAPLSDAPDPRGFDIAGFGYPVYAYNTPLFFLRFVETLPDAGGMPAFIFKTSGEPFQLNGASSWALVRALRKKGFVPMLERHFLMPYNILFRYKDALVKQMYLHTRDMAEVLAEQIAADRRQEFRFRPLSVLATYLFRLQRFGALINGLLIRAKKTLCTGCGLCARACPASNVRMDGGRPRFGGRCTMCMACAYYCPKDAVRPGLLSPLRVNGPYPFKKLAQDDSVPATFIDESTRGYFRLFWPYYKRTAAEIEALKAEREEENTTKDERETIL